MACSICGGGHVPRGVGHDGSRFGRLYGNLPPLAWGEPIERLDELGEPGGRMSTGALPANYNQENGKIPAGFIFLGQFIDHDITLDTTSNIERQNDPGAVRNFRTPGLDLDCLYGAGPEASPHLYDRDTGVKLLMNDENPTGDLPRNWQGRALIGDPRNDENLIVSQLQLAFVKFHNVVVDDRKGAVPDGELFEEASRLVRWHYQWVVMHEFLPLIVGANRADALREHGPRFYPLDGEPFIPVEFSAAGYRFGHSMTRDSYDVNSGTTGKGLFELNPGFSPVPDGKRVEWWRLFKISGAAAPQNSHKIDVYLPDSLLSLPVEVVDLEADDPRRSLAVRNLQRGNAFDLPSGEAVARRIGADPLTAQERNLDGLAESYEETPLWYYVLKEAEVRENGRNLGDVGAAIVGEVLCGLLAADPMSYLNLDPEWTPVYGQGGKFGMADLLNMADSYSPPGP